MPPPHLGCVVEKDTVKQERSIVVGQNDICADVAAKSQSTDYPSVDSVHASIAKGMVNLLAIAAATEITFEEARPEKALLVESSCAEDEEETTNEGPPLFGLHPNGLLTFGLSLIGLQGYLDYRHLDYL